MKNFSTITNSLPSWLCPALNNNNNNTTAINNNNNDNNNNKKIIINVLIKVGIVYVTYQIYSKISKELKNKYKIYGETRRLQSLGIRDIDQIPENIDHKEYYFINKRKMALYCQEYLPKNESNNNNNGIYRSEGHNVKGVIFLCHGYGDSSSWFFRDIALRLVSNGYRVIGIDYEGHGKSDGLHVHIPCFITLVEDVCDYFSSVIYETEGGKVNTKKGKDKIFYFR